jgi:hypothetical protein
MREKNCHSIFLWNKIIEVVQVTLSKINEILSKIGGRDGDSCK